MSKSLNATEIPVTLLHCTMYDVCTKLLRFMPVPMWKAQQNNDVLVQKASETF